MPRCACGRDVCSYIPTRWRHMRQQVVVEEPLSWWKPWTWLPRFGRRAAAKRQGLAVVREFARAHGHDPDEAEVSYLGWEIVKTVPERGDGGWFARRMALLIVCLDFPKE